MRRQALNRCLPDVADLSDCALTSASICTLCWQRYDRKNLVRAGLIHAGVHVRRQENLCGHLQAPLESAR